MKWRIEDAPVFAAVVERGGVTAAADHLKMPKSSVSKCLARLEHDLGVRLLDRNTRSVRTTPEGDAFFRQCQTIMEQVAEADAVMGGLASVPAGRLAAAMPTAFCQEILAPHLAEFYRRYPRIELEIVVTSETVDIIRNQFDCAVVVGVQEDSRLIQRTLLGGRLIWIVSPAYLQQHGIGETPAEIAAHVHICEQRYASRPLALKWNGQTGAVDFRRRVLRVNDPVTVREAVIAGAGVSFLPDRYCGDGLKHGTLRRVAEHVEFEMSASVMSVVYPGRRLMAARTRAFVDFLFEICRPAADAKRKLI